MGIFCSRPKFLTNQHHSIFHKGYHSEHNCFGNHCSIDIWCKSPCLAKYTVCADCTQINKIRKFRCNYCWSDIYIDHQLELFYKQEQVRFAVQHHK